MGDQGGDSDGGTPTLCNPEATSKIIGPIGRNPDTNCPFQEQWSRAWVRVGAYNTKDVQSRGRDSASPLRLLLPLSCNNTSSSLPHFVLHPATLCPAL